MALVVVDSCELGESGCDLRGLCAQLLVEPATVTFLFQVEGLGSEVGCYGGGTEASDGGRRCQPEPPPVIGSYFPGPDGGLASPVSGLG